MQIYGLTTPEDAALVAQLGADHIGLVAGKYRRTADEVDYGLARRIFAAIPPPTLKVALTLADDIAEIVGLAREVRPDILHLAAPLDQFGPDGVYQVKQRLPDLPVIQTVAVDGPRAVYVAAKFATVADYLLLDSRHPATGHVGASGVVHDWTLSRRIVEAVGVPVILAGGLTPENVAEAIQVVQPWGVDSQTGTSRADDPRRKDADKVRRFIEAVRATTDDVLR